MFIKHFTNELRSINIVLLIAKIVLVVSTLVCFNLTPKIPFVFFLPISAVSDLLGGIHFSTKKCMRT